MPFAPHEIENKKFVIALRGYQTEEVEAFLRAVAADYRALVEGRESSEAASGRIAALAAAADGARPDEPYDDWVARRLTAWAREASLSVSGEVEAIKREALEEAAATRDAAQAAARELLDATEQETTRRRAALEDILRHAETAAARRLEEAEQAAEKLRSEALEEAAFIRESAASEAAAIRAAASDEAERTYAELEQRTAEVGRLETSLRDQIETVDALLGAARTRLAPAAHDAEVTDLALARAERY
jgi:DivIVA domain-containing protein